MRRTIKQTLGRNQASALDELKSGQGLSSHVSNLIRVEFFVVLSLIPLFADAQQLDTTVKYVPPVIRWAIIRDPVNVVARMDQPDFINSWATAEEMAKWNCTGGNLFYQTYLPGTNDWYSQWVCTDNAGTAYLAGGSAKTGFCPTRPGQLADQDVYSTLGNAAFTHTYPFPFPLDPSSPQTYSANIPANLPIRKTACAITTVDPFKNLGPPPTCVGNPINPFTGNKYLKATDYVGAGGSNLRFERFYNSHVGAPYQDVWTHTFRKSIIFHPFPNAGKIGVLREDGRQFTFEFVGDVATSDPDVVSRVVRLRDGTSAPSGYRYYGTEDDIEVLIST